MKVKSVLLQSGHGFPFSFMLSTHSLQIFFPQGQLMTHGSPRTCRQIGHSVWKAAVGDSTNWQSCAFFLSPPEVLVLELSEKDLVDRDRGNHFRRLPASHAPTERCGLSHLLVAMGTRKPGWVLNARACRSIHRKNVTPCIDDMWGVVLTTTGFLVSEDHQLIFSYWLDPVMVSF